jgi:hypothetical protein
MKENTAAKTNVTLGYMLDEWSASHSVEETTRTTYRLLIEDFIRLALGDTPISRLPHLRSVSVMRWSGDLDHRLSENRSSPCSAAFPRSWHGGTLQH